MRNSGKIIFAVMLLVSMLPLTSCGKSEAPGLSSGGVGGNEGGTSEEYKYPKPSQSAIRLMTYNSYYCRGNTGTPAVSQTNTENFARVIKTLDADIVAIQELDKGALNRNKRDLLQEIADATGIDYQVVFAPAADYMGGKIGPGVLVKRSLGVKSTKTVELPGDEGRMLVVVETEGVSCHSSNPEKGVNAVYAMTAVIDEIRKIVPNEHPLLGKGILELTDIISQPYPGASVVPSLCRATFDRRTLVGEDEAVILGQVNEAIARAQETHPGLKARCYLAEGEEKCWTGDTIRARRYFPAWVTEEDSELVQAALKGLKDAGIEAPLSHFSFCTNGSSFCGEAGIPTIGYGPSLESLAHVRDEYIEIDQLLKSCKGFESILTQLTHESA